MVENACGEIASMKRHRFNLALQYLYWNNGYYKTALPTVERGSG
jgi:hypothetical protein